MQDAPKAVWTIPYISVASFFPSLKQNFIAYHSSKVSSCPDCIFKIHQQWQSSFSRVYSNCCCSCSFKPEIIKMGKSSQKLYSNKILNFQESMTILNACTKKVWKLIEGTSIWFVSTFCRYTQLNGLIVLFLAIQFGISQQVKWFQVLLYITNNSIKHLSFVYTHLNDQTIQFLTIQFSIYHLFAHSLNAKEISLTHR